MKSQFYSIFIIISLISIIPLVNAQEINIAEKAEHKSIEVTINDVGDIHVKHVILSSNILKQVKLIDGTVQNLTTINENGGKQLVTTVGDNDSILIHPSNKNTIIEYNLENVLSQNNNFWTWDFFYLGKIVFIVPENIKMVFANERLVNLDGKKGFNCNGCEMILEYAFDTPTVLKNIEWEDKEFNVKLKTFVEIQNVEFEQSFKEIKFNINGNNQYITAIIPLELLWGPYSVFLDDEKIFFNQNYYNGTHAWLSMKPDTSGEISIIGTTVIPEFPIIAPLAIGFLIILVLPMMKKFNLR